MGFRSAMRQVPSCVAAVTTAHHQDFRGLTIGSLASVSLDPPLISFNVMRSSRMHDLITCAERYAVHILSEKQAALSVLLAAPELTGPQQFATIPHTRDADGIPLIQDTVVILHCQPYRSYPLGDHTVLIGHVVRTTEGAGIRPLVYHDGQYRQLGEPIHVDAASRLR